MDTPIEKLKKMTAWDTAPALTEAELTEVLGNAGISDVAGFSPASADWQPTYDLNQAAAAAWMMKAGRASALVEADPPGSGLFTSKVFENCLAMARIYSAKSRAAVKVSMPII
ncbi:MAG TPA: hypothetical protein DEA22_09080 [Blastocatellia bacterium]|nr:hypothetical protein [Blastocatellia bacterium]